MNKLEKTINYAFKNKDLLREALTHSSYANENPREGSCNERLEFLGDSVLSLATADYLFTVRNGVPEGRLTKERAAIVCEQSLFNFAKKLDLGSYIKLGRGEQHSGGSNRPSVLSDAMEALIAAIYLDGGYDKAKEFVLSIIPEVREIRGISDYKTLLQEIAQSFEQQVCYDVVQETGPDHDKTFNVEVHLSDGRSAAGFGKSKKAAEQNAAMNVLDLMGYDY